MRSYWNFHQCSCERMFDGGLSGDRNGSARRLALSLEMTPQPVQRVHRAELPHRLPIAGDLERGRVSLISERQARKRRPRRLSLLDVGSGDARRRETQVRAEKPPGSPCHRHRRRRSDDGTFWLPEKLPFHLTRVGHDTAPEYRYQEPSPLEVRPIPVAETIAKPVPVEQRTTSVKEPLPPVPEPEAPQEAAPLTMPEESRPEYRNEQPLRQKIEGIPRCPKCGVAVSGFDEFCSECGTKLK